MDATNGEHLAGVDRGSGIKARLTGLKRAKGIRFGCEVPRISHRSLSEADAGCHNCHSRDGRTNQVHGVEQIRWLLEEQHATISKDFRELGELVLGEIAEVRTQTEEKF